MTISENHGILTDHKAAPGICAKNLLNQIHREVAVSPTEAVVALTVDMNPLGIHLGRAPLAARILSSIGPLRAGLVDGA